MSTARIDINGMGSSFGGTIAVDRSMPAILEGQLSLHSWNTICDEIDESLEPVNKGMKKFFRLLKLFGLLEMTLIVLFLVLFFTSINRNDYSMGGFYYYFLPFIFAIVSMIIFFPTIMCWFVKVNYRALEDLRSVCDNISTKHQGISFHLREEQVLYSSGSRVRAGTKCYIEADGSSTAAPAFSTATPAFNPSISVVDAVAVSAEPGFNSESGSSKKSPAERMKELNDMRGLLTEDEYQRKRAEILSDV